MAKIVCITTGLTGILHASFELMARLEGAGHQLVCAAPQDVGEKVLAQGFRYRQLPPLALETEPELPAFSGPLRKIKRWLYKWTHRKQRRKEALNTIGGEEILQRLQSFSADLLIIDIELHEYIFTAHSAGLPYVLLSQWFSLWKRPGLPYLLRDTIPGLGWSGKTPVIKMDWWRVKWQRRWMFSRKKWMSVGTDRRSSLLQLADQTGFPRKYIRENFWPGPFTYRHLPVISMTAWAMEFPHEKRRQLFYVGPMVYTNRKEIRQEAAEKQKLAGVLESSRKRSGALIYCSVSSLKAGDQHFLKKVCEAVAGEPDWTLILGLGGLIERDFLDTIPPNVHPFSWVPQLEILAAADCSINHGGIHTLNECIHFQVPVLVYSGKRSDQNGCAARVAYHEMGLTGDKDKDSVADIHRKIRELLSNERYRNQMQYMHRQYQAYKTESVLEKTVEKFLM
jgi:UDP:flavonoid glycosyltransferase YjiC (YdhE family)